MTTMKAALYSGIDTQIVTHRFPLDEITEAFAIAADKESGAIKVHILNQGGSA